MQGILIALAALKTSDFPGAKGGYRRLRTLLTVARLMIVMAAGHG
jgi:hypothetical protein